MNLDEARALLNDRVWCATVTREEFEAVYNQVQAADIYRQPSYVIESATGGGIVRYSGATNVPRPTSP